MCSVCSFRYIHVLFTVLFVGVMFFRSGIKLHIYFAVVSDLCVRVRVCSVCFCVWFRICLFWERHVSFGGVSCFFLGKCFAYLLRLCFLSLLSSSCLFLLFLNLVSSLFSLFPLVLLVLIALIVLCAVFD